MRMSMRRDAERIVSQAIQAVQPDAAVRQALWGRHLSGRVVLVAVGKAAWQMAKTAHDCLKERIEQGVVITKYGHAKGALANFRCYE